MDQSAVNVPRLLMVLLALAVCAIARAEPRSLTINAETRQVALGKFIQYRALDRVESNPLQLRNEPGWHTSDRDVINLGYQARPYLFRMSMHVDANAASKWLLELSNPMLDSVEVFLYSGGQLVQQWHVGDRQPFNARIVDSPFFVLPLILKPDHDYQLYLRVHNTEAMEIPAQLFSPLTFATYSAHRAELDGIFNGFLIIIAAYSLALYIILLDRTYLYYVSYVLSMLAFFLIQQGLLYPWFYPGSPLMEHYGVIYVSLWIFLSVALFFRAFLELPEKVPRLWSVYKALLVVHAVICVLFSFIDYQVAMFMLVVNTLMATSLAAISIVTLSWRGSRSAQIVLVGWALLLAFLFFFAGAKTGLFYNDFLANYGLRLGISIEILIFSFALAFRFNQDRKEKELALNQVNEERAQRILAQELVLQREMEARQAKELALSVEIRHRETLEHLVEERTADLERTLSNLEQANRELERLSAHDGLTGVFNRRVFDEKLQTQWQIMQRNAAPLALLIIDIDHFKHINDNRGHPCGDYVLREFAQQLTGLLHRPSDVIARYGGEEFAILLPDTPVEGAKVVADSIVRKTARQLYRWEESTFHISVSIGVDVMDASNDLTPASLIGHADAALYQAKQTGRNRWVLWEPES